MEKRTYIYVVLVTFIIVLSGSMIYLIFSSEGGGPPASPASVQELDECKVASYSGEDAINFVFFSPKEQALEYSDYLLATTPFNEQKDSFNIFYIDDYDTKNDCEIYKGIALLCRSDDLVQKAASCPNDYIVVLEEKPPSIRSSAYQNVMSLNSIHPKTVFLHEFGHVFVDFAEEYVAETAKIPRGSENCQKRCSGFGDIIEGCYEGCSRSDYFRSVENGVMRTLSPTDGVVYGLFNENLLRERIEEELSSLFFRVTGGFLGVTGNVVADLDNSCSNQERYIATVDYNEADGLKVVDERVERGCAGGSGYGPVEYRLLDGEGNAILEKGIKPFVLYAEGPGEVVGGLTTITGDVILDPFDQYEIQAPLNSEVEALEIVDEQGRETEINLRGAGARPCRI